MTIGSNFNGSLNDPFDDSFIESLKGPDNPHGSERGQSTVEYALLLLGAAAIAMLVVAWVAKSDMIGKLFDIVLGRIVDQA